MIRVCGVSALTVAIVTQGVAHVTGVFSTMRYSEASGDVLGFEIIVSRDSSGFRVRFREAEGVPGPVLTVSATVKGDSIFFELPPDTTHRFKPDGNPYIAVEQRAFRGEVTATRLRGRITGYYDELDLPRRPDSRGEK
jgi:hypothetical protein